MAATNTGTDNIDIAPENADFEAVDVDTNDDDTGTPPVRGTSPPHRPQQEPTHLQASTFA